jgi:hypothetical protein
MVPTLGGHVWVERRKWPDRPHYGSEGIVLGEDQHGVWVGARPGDRMYKGTESPVSGRYPIVWCIPPAGWFLAHFLVGHPDLDIYIDIAAPAKWSERGASLVDLDFDVVVWNESVLLARGLRERRTSWPSSRATAGTRERHPLRSA